ncbi:type II secretion system minor pseudopilin GspK [Gammaproteobacteria bacterium]|nr:type II secretion system minor pseudopilin GspK [Gammaproteobacteria bacterium]
MITRRPNAHRLDRQRGVALILVLMVVALATVLLTYAATDNELSLRRYEIASNQAQMDEILQATTLLARLRLEEDISPIDHLGEEWAQLITGELLDSVEASAEIVDLASRFNINNLFNPENRTIWMIAFRRLLDLLDFDDPEESANRIADWIDIDDRTIDGNDDEDSSYENDRGLLPYNRQLVHSRELLTIPELDRDEIERLLPYVIAVKVFLPGDVSGNFSTGPIGQPLAINFNTCDPLFFNLFTERRLSTIETRQLIDEREEEPYDANDLLRIRTTMLRDFGLMYGVQGDAVNAAFNVLAGVGTRAFAIVTRVQSGELRAVRTSIVRLNRSNTGKPRTHVIETFPGEGLDG